MASAVERAAGGLEYRSELLDGVSRLRDEAAERPSLERASKRHGQRRTSLVLHDYMRAFLPDNPVA